MIEIKEFAKHLADFTVFDCAVCSPDLFYFIAFDQRCRYNHDKRLIACHRADGNAMPQWSSTPLTAWDSTTLAYSPEEGACLAAFCRSVHVQGSAGSGWEDDIPFDDTQKIGCRGGIERLKEIDGALYACGSARTVGVRRGAGQWQWILADLPVMDAHDDSSFGGRSRILMASRRRTSTSSVVTTMSGNTMAIVGSGWTFHSGRQAGSRQFAVVAMAMFILRRQGTTGISSTDVRGCGLP